MKRAIYKAIESGRTSGFSIDGNLDFHMKLPDFKMLTTDLT